MKKLLLILILISFTIFQCSAPSRNSSKTSPSNSTISGLKSSCEKCQSSSECGLSENNNQMFCCPYMKKCVESSDYACPVD
ncbi:MAG: hypothetical protein H7A23_02735 [Leptospiraceae bacterium]|nr:hypothetical protein [Leptospiraceae bacterium]MCP5493448.1 hypothetical protein [Leptospiraceae bacterium]